MYSGKSLVGRQIISIEDGSHLGNLRDIYVDGSLKSLVAIFIGRESMFSRRAKFIHRKDITVLGKDAILVSSAKAITTGNRNKEFPKWIRRDHLQGRAIHTPGGTKIGNVGDIAIDNSGRLLIGVTISNIQVTSPIAEKRIIWRDAILNVGSESEAMLVDLAIAEEQSKKRFN